MTKSTNDSVLIVGNFLRETLGHAGVCEELDGRLATSGWEVITTSRHAAPARRAADMVRTAWRERDRFAVAQVDVYSGRAFAWAEAVCWTLRRTGKPYVLILRGGDLPAFARRWPARVRRLLGSARSVVAPSAFLHHELRAYRADLGVIPNPLETSRYPFRLRARAEPRIAWLRAFHEVYNPSLAVRMLAELMTDYPDARLAMIGRDKGDGSLSRTRREAEALGVLDRVELPGGVPKSEVPDRLAACDVFVNTTNVDNTPVSVMEAMACGLCVVSTDAGGIPFLLEDGRDALLVPRDDPAAMAGAVRRILADPELARTLSTNARRKAETFDWSRVLPRIESSLREAARDDGGH